MAQFDPGPTAFHRSLDERRGVVITDGPDASIPPSERREICPAHLDP